MSSLTRKRVLDAAKLVFARYGFQKTTMSDIARAAGVSRPSVYQSFSNKEALFKALAEMIGAEALDAADGAWTEAAPLAEGLPAAILAKDLPLFRLLHASPHGAELLAVDEALTAAMAKDLEAGFTALLAAKAASLRARGQLDLSAFDSPEDFAATVSRLAAGLKNTAANEDDYADGVHRLCRLVSAATARTAG